MKRSAIFLAVSSLFAEAALAQALPSGGTTTAGSATISSAGSAMTVSQSSQRALIDWTSFNIGSGASVTFSQPGAGAIAVNRVGAGGGRSTIDGALSANGQVAILNPNGVLFGATATVNVAGLIASTGNINDAQFMSSSTAPFAITGATAGSVENRGAITVGGAGLAAFVAPSVVNSGSISALGGRIVLAGAQAATVSLNGGLYELAVSQGIDGGSAASSGTLSTFTGGPAAGTIVVSALDAANLVSGVINLEGILRASRIEVHGGVVELKSDLNAPTVTGSSLTVDAGTGADLQDAIGIAASGASVHISPGTFARSATLNVNKPLTLSGAGEAQTMIDARSVSGYGILVNADGVSLSDFTLYGPAANLSSAYGIKVQPAGSAPASRLHDFSIARVTSRGAGRAELDLNGVVGATIDHVTANGAPVGGSGTTAGAGIQITDSADVVISNSTTLNNAWGGVALFQANRFFDQQTTGVSVAASSSFAEPNPLYLQDESAALDFGVLSLPGFAYAVRNPATAGGVVQSQFTWMQPTAQGAFDFAVNLLSPGTSAVQGWDGAALTPRFHVGVGNLSGGGTQAMSIMAAVDQAAAGAVVDIRPGNYTEVATGRTIGPGVGGTYSLGLLLSKDDLTLRGVDAGGNPITGADSVQAWIIAGASTNFGMNHGVVGDNVTAEGLGFKPYAPGPNKTIEIAGDNFTFRNSVVDNRSAAGGAGALYFGELLTGPGGEIARLTVTGSKFLDGSVSVQNGVGVAADGTYQPAADRVISGNVFTGSPNYRFGGLLLTGQMSEIPWRPLPIGAVTASGNAFSGFDDSVLVRGAQQGVDLAQIMATNSFDRSVLATDPAGNARGELYASTNPVTGEITLRPKYSIQSSIQAGLGRAESGDSVTVGIGTYAEDVLLSGQRNLLFNGSIVRSLTVDSCSCTPGLGGTITASGTAGFDLRAPVVLLADTVLDSSAAGGPVSTAAIDGATSGGQQLTIHAGAGVVTLGSLGAATRLGATEVAGGAIHFIGASYSAMSLHFTGPITLGASPTLFSTDGGDIVLDGDIQNADGSAHALSFSSGSGDLTLVSGGSAANPLGKLTVAANDFTLLGTLWVTGYQIDALGSVALSDHTLRSVGGGQSNAISAGGSVTGSTFAQSAVTVQSGGSVSGSFDAPGIALSAQGTVSAAVNAPGPVLVTSGGPANISGSAPTLVIDAPGGSASGSFGQVTNIGSGLIEVNGTPQINTTLAQNANSNRVIPVDIATGASAPYEAAPVRVRRRTLEDALEVIENGEALEIDLSPRN